jgi:hypothetical protein
MNCTATEGTSATAAPDLDDHFSAVLINAEIYAAECGFDMHLCHGTKQPGVCTCRSGAFCTDVGKHPRRKGWKNLSTRDIGTLREWFNKHPDSNLGIRTGNGLVVIDVDPKNGGFETLAALEAELGSLPRTHVVKTGSGGLHIFLSVEAKYSHAIESNEGKVGSGVDIRAKGGQVVAAPGIHKSGNRYEWLVFTPGPLSPVPAAWVQRLVEVSSKHPRPDATQTPKVRRPRKKRQAKQKVTQEQIEGTKKETVVGAICNILDCDPKSRVVARVGAALIRRQVTDSGMTNFCIYKLAAGLRNIPELSDKTGEELLPLVEFWFNVGRPYMSDKSWGSVKSRWIQEAWPWAESQYGPAWDAARKVVTPAMLAEAEKSRSARRLILKTICSEMQQQAYGGMWFLTCRTSMDILHSFGFEVTHMTTSRWMNAFVADGFLVKCDYRDADCPETQFYMTAEAAARCDEHDRLQQERQHAQEQALALVFAPINMLAQFLLQLPLPEPVGTLADTFAKAGRDEPDSTPSLVFNWRPLPVESVCFRWQRLPTTIEALTTSTPR